MAELVWDLLETVAQLPSTKGSLVRNPESRATRPDPTIYSVRTSAMIN